MRNSNQGGSLAGFIIVGILLALVLVGGLYGLNRYNAQRAAESAAKTTKTIANKVVEKTKTAQTNDSKTATGSSSTSTDTSSSATSTTGRTNSSTETDNSKDGATSSVSTTTDSTSNLPHTGPSDSITSFAAVTLLSFAGVHYVRSRVRS